MNLAHYFLDMADVAEGEAVVRVQDPELGPGWRWYRSPIQVVTVHDLEGVATALKAADDHVAQGGHAVIALSYESAPAFDSALAVKKSGAPFLVWIGLYEANPAHYRELLPNSSPLAVKLQEPEWTLGQYGDKFERVRSHLAAGDTYQVNLTFRQPFELSGSAAAFFVDRCGVDPPPYATFIHGGGWQICSFSPELLFERTGARVVMKPMKGTVPCPSDRKAIAEAAEKMRSDPKSIAENIMIVDMVRNDLGAVSDYGSVSTPTLLEVERHRGLLQMTSTVQSTSEVSLFDLLRHTFPAASVTGAPKVETSQIIVDLETSSRGIYCGAIGTLEPGKERFAVAIRSAFIRGEEGVFGIGSGVVWDSDCASEYQECLDKRNVLVQSGRKWEVREAIPAHRMESAPQHLQRLAATCGAFRIPIDLSAIESAVANIPSANAAERLKASTGVQIDGSFHIRIVPSVVKSDRIRAMIARRPLCSHDPNLRIKTSSRAMLDDFLDQHREFDEVLLWNQSGLATEFCYGNLVVLWNGRFVTPKPEHGCLPGIGVKELIETGKAEYGTLQITERAGWEKVFFINSVTGLVEVSLFENLE